MVIALYNFKTLHSPFNPLKSFVLIREEKDKLNIWVALPNLDNLYDTQEAHWKVFDEALRQNEPIDVFLKLVTIYQNSEKYEVSYPLVKMNNILIPLLLACRAVVSNND